MAFQKREKKTIARNKAARHEYFVDETFEAGLVLTCLLYTSDAADE